MSSSRLATRYHLKWAHQLASSRREGGFWINWEHTMRSPTQSTPSATSTSGIRGSQSTKLTSRNSLKHGNRLEIVARHSVTDFFILDLDILYRCSIDNWCSIYSTEIWPTEAVSTWASVYPRLTISNTV